MKNHLKIILECMMKLTSTKDSKISPKCFPKPLQNPPKWSESNPENRLPASTKLSESFQDDFKAQHDPKMVQKSSHKASKIQRKLSEMNSLPADYQKMPNSLASWVHPLRSRAPEHVKSSYRGQTYCGVPENTLLIVRGFERAEK